MAEASKKRARRSKASSDGRMLGCPSLVWGLVILGSLALNLVTIALLASIYEGNEPSGCRTQSAGLVAEDVREPQSSAKDEEEMVSAREISVSSTSGSRPASKDAVINLDHGDPTMYESFWRRMGRQGDITIAGWQAMSYFSDVTNLCWFLEPDFAHEIRRLHRLVGNAVADECFIIVGTGSTQLFQAALYALSPPDTTEPLNVVSAVPYYSSYPAVTDYLRSGLYRWAGDASTFNGDTYIELVCSPNNPDGSIREAALNSKNGKTIHDLAYYWPQYTPITHAADHDIMLFTVSKSTGHAGTRLGWALVRDKVIAKRMIKFIELNTIGVSKDSQLRAANILKVVSDGYELPICGSEHRLFNYGRKLMSVRWQKLREAVKVSGIFSLPEFQSALCKFTGEKAETYPAFAWLKCEKRGVDDCESFLRNHRILTRSGRHFGMEPKYVRISMLDRDETFDLLIERLSSLH
ncbi:tryptophan aminotransferase-related protein 2-like [Canna indica]|uniref:Tryptophan aminotransferase-related protein 2-like n=1 Tax=Canna indica TaxID=4628 RepID=A0AAQ3K5A7_9LILI|nr:tryptophan aminotransferase-related protein 2-like [Canna indica]